MVCPYRAVLFDLDGTLLDTLQDLADSANSALRSLGLPIHPVDSYRTFVGDGVDILVRRVLPEERRDSNTVGSLKAAFREEYSRRWKDATRPYPGVPELLDALSGRGVILTVLSNKPHAATQAVAGHFFSRWPFAVFWGQRESHPRKPDPAAALEICRAVGVEPGEMLYVGDTNTDMQTARRAGMFAVGALWGFRSREELLASGAQALVSHPAELLRFFD